jgi:hypothetical protein
MDETMQSKVVGWLLECFGEGIAKDKVERNHRFLEEALELVQSCGCTKSEALQLVEYVYNRPVGETRQEVGGASITLMALCFANGISMDDATEIELERIWQNIDKIREKQANKPKYSPLPQIVKPPIGLRPRHISDAMRAIEIDEAVARYVVEGKDVPADWIEELREIHQRALARYAEETN